MAKDFDPEEWITTKEASRLTGHTAEALGRLAREGLIKGWKRGRDWFLNKADVQAYAAEMAALPKDAGPKDWVTTTEAAELTGYTAEALRRLARGGLIKAWKRGRDWFLSKAEVLAYTEEMATLPTDTGPKDWITTAEASRLTGYSAITLRLLAREGRIKARKRGRDWFLDKANVLAYAEEMKRLGTAKHAPTRGKKK